MPDPTDYSLLAGIMQAPQSLLGTVNQGLNLARPIMPQVGSAPMVPGASRAPVRLVVARKMPNGTIKYGKSGDYHSDLVSDAELKFTGTEVERMMAERALEKSLGFALPGGRFLSRAEAGMLMEAHPTLGSPSRRSDVHASDLAE